jgi:hypothetical protein
MGTACARGAAVVLGVVLAAGPVAAQPKPSDGAATEKLLKEIKGLEYTKVKEGVFKLVIERKDGLVRIILEEKKAPWKDKNGGEVLYLYFYSEVLTYPAGFKPPAAMTTMMNEWNDRAQFGNISLSKNQDGSMTLLRNGSMFLRGADTEQLLDQLLLVISDQPKLRTDYAGFKE